MSFEEQTDLPLESMIVGLPVRRVLILHHSRSEQGSLMQTRPESKTLENFYESRQELPLESMIVALSVH